MKNSIYRSLPPGDDSYPKTRIMATIGRRTTSYETLMEMVEAGVSIFRLNGGHLTEDEDSQDELTYSQAEKIVEQIRMIRENRRQVIGIYFDLAGPKIRLSDVISVNSSDIEKPNFLHPEKGDEIIIIPFQKKIQDAFKKAVADFETENKNVLSNKNNLSWAKPSDVKKFFMQERLNIFYRKFPALKSNAKAYIIMLRDIPSKFDPNNFKEKGVINFKDGLCSVEIRENNGASLRCIVTEVRSSFEFRPGQGVNPYQYIFPNIITEKDKNDIHFALQIGADIISQSFVCHPEDATMLKAIIEQKKNILRRDKGFHNKSEAYKRYLGKEFQIPVYAKIETVFAVKKTYNDRFVANQNGAYTKLKKNYDPLREIVKSFDGIMVARGDLAVETSKVEVPGIQERTIKLCRCYNKPVIVATEVLDSMKKGDASTRAEIDSIIKTVKYEEPDVIMLSGETASTQREPKDAVVELCRAIKQAEKDMLKYDEEKNLEQLFVDRKAVDKKINEIRFSNGQQVCYTARSVKSQVIIASVNLGEAARDIAYFRPSQRIIAITDNILTAVDLLLYRGVYPIVTKEPIKRNLDSFLEILMKIDQDIGLPVSGLKNKSSTFQVPGLIKLIPEKLDYTQLESYDEAAPNTIYNFTLPIIKKLDRMKQNNIEIELKFLLSEKNYEKLRLSLVADKVNYKVTRQANYYYHDSKGILSRKKKVSLRLRHEIKQVLAKGGGWVDDKANVGQYYFTYKGDSKLQESGILGRVENEYNITKEICDNENLDFKNGANFFKKLPPFYKEVALGPFKNEVLKSYQKSQKTTIDDVEFSYITSMNNLRYCFQMANGFLLELDKTTYLDKNNKEHIRFELEIELGIKPLKNVEINVREYVHDKFAMLDIPVIDGEKYPSKAMITYYYSGAEILSGQEEIKIENRLDQVDLDLNLHHGEICDKCQILSKAHKKLVAKMV